MNSGKLKSLAGTRTPTPEVMDPDAEFIKYKVRLSYAFRKIIHTIEKVLFKFFNGIHSPTLKKILQD